MTVFAAKSLRKSPNHSRRSSPLSNLLHAVQSHLLSNPKIGKNLRNPRLIASILGGLRPPTRLLPIVRPRDRQNYATGKSRINRRLSHIQTVCLAVKNCHMLPPINAITSAGCIVFQPYAVFPVRKDHQPCRKRKPPSPSIAAATRKTGAAVNVALGPPLSLSNAASLSAARK